MELEGTVMSADLVKRTAECVEFCAGHSLPDDVTLGDLLEAYRITALALNETRLIVGSHAPRLAEIVETRLDEATALLAKFTKEDGVMAEKVLHCWEGGPDEPDGMSTTCMLLDGHDGPHEWTRDDRISIRFAQEGEPA